MARKIITQASGDNVPLCDQFGQPSVPILLPDSGKRLPDFRQQQRIVRAGQQNSINLWVLTQQFAQVFLHKPIRAFGEIFATFDKRHPKCTCLLRDMQSSEVLHLIHIGEDFFQLQYITAGGYRTRGCENTDMAIFRNRRNSFDRGTNHPQYAMRFGANIMLLNGAKCFCRCGIAS